MLYHITVHEDIVHQVVNITMWYIIISHTYLNLNFVEVLCSDYNLSFPYSFFCFIFYWDFLLFFNFSIKDKDTIISVIFYTVTVTQLKSFCHLFLSGQSQSCCLALIRIYTNGFSRTASAMKPLLVISFLNRWIALYCNNR